MTSTLAVIIETGARRSFASVADWPGWCRGGRNESEALDALRAYGERYRAVLMRGAVGTPPAGGADFTVIERLPGNATTDFGAPSAIAKADRRAAADPDAAHLCAVLEACWAELDAVAAGAPATLRKGPRGGGRDRDAVLTHVFAADAAYARKIGGRIAAAPVGDVVAITAARTALLDHLRPALRDPAGGAWPGRYVVRRVAWHVLDHAWEIEDRSA